MNYKDQPEGFLQEILAKDQASLDHQAAAHNIAVLTQKETQEFFTTHEAYADIYHNALSITYFHLGQLIAKTNTTLARTPFAHSLDAALQIQNPEHKDWQIYVRATLAYFDQDISVLEEAYSQLPGDKNKEVVGRLLQGLRSRGALDYAADYTI
jgi:hypothetical protein